MITSKTQNERKFLIDMAVREFNRQYRRNIDPKFCTINSIRATYGCTHGYEIKTIVENDFLRLRIYFNLQRYDKFCPYRLETDETDIPGRLGDEVYVMIGTINNYYVDNGIYRFRWLGDDPLSDDYFLFMSGEHVEFMTGEKVKYVDKGI